MLRSLYLSISSCHTFLDTAVREAIAKGQGHLPARKLYFTLATARQPAGAGCGPPPSSRPEPAAGRCSSTCAKPPQALQTHTVIQSSFYTTSPRGSPSPALLGLLTLTCSFRQDPPPPLGWRGERCLHGVGYCWPLFGGCGELSSYQGLAISGVTAPRCDRWICSDPCKAGGPVCGRLTTRTCTGAAAIVGNDSTNECTLSRITVPSSLAKRLTMQSHLDERPQGSD